MPPLTAELTGLAAVIVLLLAVAVTVDPRLRARRELNRLTRLRRHAAQGCHVCANELAWMDFDARIAALRAQLALLEENAR